MSDIDNDARLTLQLTHPGFDIRCRNCESSAVGVDRNIGFSDESGEFGGIYLLCASCGARQEIYPDVFPYYDDDCGSQDERENALSKDPWTDHSTWHWYSFVPDSYKKVWAALTRETRGAIYDMALEARNEAMNQREAAEKAEMG